MESWPEIVLSNRSYVTFLFFFHSILLCRTISIMLSLIYTSWACVTSNNFEQCFLRSVTTNLCSDVTFIILQMIYWATLQHFSRQCSGELSYGWWNNFSRSLMVIENGTVLSWRIILPLNLKTFCSNYGPILYHFQDIARYSHCSMPSVFNIAAEGSSP